MTQELLYKYIAGDADPNEKASIVQWANENDANMNELRALRKLYNFTIWQRGEKVSIRKNKTHRFYRVLSIASVVLVFLMFAGGLSYISSIKKQIPEASIQTIHVPAGQRVKVTLSDGTDVWLNAGSTFSFPTLFSPDDRTVTLDGEAYFIVEKEEKPFIVETSGYHTRVRGTEFNILAYSKSEMFEVSLLEGSVEVYANLSKGGKSIVLEPNTRVYLQNNRLVKGAIKNYDYLQWKDGLICFDDESVEQMISKLELYYDISIIVENESLCKQRYVGKFRTKDGIEHILKVFQLKNDFTYERDDENNIITIH